MKLHRVVNNNKSSRIFYIDILRGLALFCMIFLHTGVYYLQQKFVYILYNLTDFVNVAFLFCSCYVFFEHSKKNNPINWTSIKKRILRLVLPYYIFLFCYFILLYFTDRSTITTINVIKHIVMWNGIYVSWLVILFIFFAFLNPIILFLKTNNTLLYYLFFLLSFLSSIIFLFLKIQNYAYILCIPYSLTIYYAMWIRNNMKNTRILFLTFTVLMIFLVPIFLFKNSENQTPLLDNKYPPNLYYLFYSFIVIDVFFLLNRFSLMKDNIINRFFIYLGTYSYELFFIHILIIYVLHKCDFFIQTNWAIGFIVVLAMSLIVQLISKQIYVLPLKLSFVDDRDKSRYRV